MNLKLYFFNYILHKFYYCLFFTETTTAPSFRKKLKNVTTTEDETIELTVEYEGSPKPTTKW